MADEFLGYNSVPSAEKNYRAVPPEELPEPGRWSVPKVDPYAAFRGSLGDDVVDRVIKNVGHRRASAILSQLASEQTMAFRGATNVAQQGYKSNAPFTMEGEGGFSTAGRRLPKVGPGLYGVANILPILSSIMQMNTPQYKQASPIEQMYQLGGVPYQRPQDLMT